MEIDVSVVMSVYNGAQYLNEAIESILKQTLKNFEFVIIDDGSTDNSKEIIQSYHDDRIVIIEQNNTGLAIALNNAIRETKSALIARMDADDIAMPERLERQINFLKANPEFVLVGTNAHVIDMNGDYIYSSDLPLKWDDIESKFPLTSFFHSSVMFRKETFYKAGGYFEGTSRLYSFEDSILWNKMKLFGIMANLEQPLIKYRLLPNAATTKSGKEGKVVLSILEDIIKDKEISLENREKLLQIKQRLDQHERERIYYLHLAKKYLWNNYIPKKSRENLRAAIKMQPFYLYPYILYLMTYFSKELILRIYSSIKAR